VIFLSWKSLHIDVLERKDIFEHSLHVYVQCQYGYFSEKGQFAGKGERIECGLPIKIIFYFNREDFSKVHPEICVAPPIGIKPRSFTVIAEANIDGENKILAVNDAGYVFPPNTLPRGGGKCPDIGK